MRIKQLKLIIYFLKELETKSKDASHQVVSSFFSNFFSKEELIELLEHSFFAQDLVEHQIETLSNEQLLELIGDDTFILFFLIEKLESEITSFVKLNQEEVNHFFTSTSLEPHYLFSKPISEWDSYDASNYHSLLARHGKSTCVYGIFTSDVTDQQKYEVTTKPTSLFDTQQEAEAYLERICQERNALKTDFVIHPLWRIAKN
ncbi:MAG: hypothetical protein J0L86_02715 [Flavobacteriales bacterium]|nr:hypothetical protein [Flavobacteriales bacterium]